MLHYFMFLLVSVYSIMRAFGIVERRSGCVRCVSPEVVQLGRRCSGFLFSPLSFALAVLVSPGSRRLCKVL